MFRIPEFVRTREALDPVEKLTDWDLFLVSDLISLNNQISSSDGADKVARDSAASIASAYSVSTKKITVKVKVNVKLSL